MINNMDIYKRPEKTTFKQDLKIDEYYEVDNDNYQDDVPFDLYNMVSVVKSMNRHSSLPKIKGAKKRYNLMQSDNFKLYSKPTINTSPSVSKLEKLTIPGLSSTKSRPYKDPIMNPLGHRSAASEQEQLGFSTKSMKKRTNMYNKWYVPFNMRFSPQKKVEKVRRLHKPKLDFRNK